MKWERGRKLRKKVESIGEGWKWGEKVVSKNKVQK